jgi:hypothetical protein
MEAGWEFRSTVVGVLDDQPFRATYAIGCDAGWRTREARITLESDAGERTLDLATDDQHRWWQGGEEMVDLRGCVDVDLEVTPATNTLPIRRLRPAIGEAIEPRAAWVRFPLLHVQALRQRYTRLDALRYRYENLDSTFLAELELDDLDLVTRYADVWVREPAQP